MDVRELICDFQASPIGIGSERPLLSWRLESTRYGSAQTALRVQVSETPNSWDTLLWDSGRVESDSPSIPYGGAVIPSNMRVWWRVKVWDEHGEESSWSQASDWRQGLRPDDWTGEWIGYDEGRNQYDPTQPYYCADDFEKGDNHPFLPKPALLRAEFGVDGDVESAVLYAGAMGLTRLWINGERVTENCMIPGISDYRKRTYAFAFDVTDKLRLGANAICAVLADGWYAGYIGLNPRQWWGAKPRLNAVLRVRRKDGTEREFITDDSWRGCVGPWLYADIMHGAGYDATLEPAGWMLPGFDTSEWHPVETGAEYDYLPMMHPGVPIVEHARFAPASIRRIGEDEAIIDFGHCFSGVTCMRLRGPRGARVDIFHAEELDEDGLELYFYGNRSAQAHDCYVLSGSGEEVFQPEFTYHGFRYAHIHGLSRVELLDIEGVAISSQMPEPTLLESGDSTVDEVIRLIRNTEQSNLYDVPTDVCARDERLGWGAEGHFFMHTAAALNQSALFLRKWLRDALDGQSTDGGMWPIAPAVMMQDIAPFVGDLQSDIALHCAWILMRVYGDMEPVKEAFPALVRYFEYLVNNSDRLIRFAIARDWLDLSHDGRSDFDHGYGKCDPGVIGTAWFARSAQMMAEIADAVWEKDRAEYYRSMYGKIRSAFRTFSLGRNKLLRGATQGGYLLAVSFGLIEGDELIAAREWLLADMAKCGGITWGTASTPVALQGLCTLGLGREAVKFIRRRKFPSIGYMASQGATAVWERWDTKLDGHFHPHQMNAFDHIGLATVGEWIVARLAGIEPASNGCATVSLRSVTDPEIGSMHAIYQSVRGSVEVKWRYEDGVMLYEAELPPGMSGELEFMCERDAIRIVRGEEGIGEVRCAGGRTAMRLLSGRYEFTIIQDQ